MPGQTRVCDPSQHAVLHVLPVQHISDKMTARCRTEQHCIHSVCLQSITRTATANQLLVALHAI